jgi:hypothetical protein
MAQLRAGDQSRDPLFSDDDEHTEDSTESESPPQAVQS